MITIDGTPILAGPTEILEVLRSQMSERGLSYFRTIRPPANSNVMTNCPFHKNGQERRPSFGISEDTGVCHCFTCGWTGSLEDMVSEILGRTRAGSNGRAWLLQNFLAVTLTSRENAIQVPMRRRGATIQGYIGFTDAELDKYRFYHPYMYQRGLTNELIEKFDVGYDRAFTLKDENDKIISTFPCITFPVYCVDGTPAFIARRAINSKLFHYPSGVEKPVYAADMIMQDRPSEVIVCESIFNCLTCWKHGRPAVSLLGTGTQSQYQILRELPVRKFIMGFDGDDAGRRAALRAKKALGDRRVITYLDIPEGKDINDCDSTFEMLTEYF